MAQELLRLPTRVDLVVYGTIRWKERPFFPQFEVVKQAILVAYETKRERFKLRKKIPNRDDFREFR